MKFRLLIAFLFLQLPQLSALAEDAIECVQAPVGEFEQLASKLDAANECNRYTELLERADEIGSIKAEELNPKKTKNPALGIMKLFTSAETDKIIDLFAQCGRKKGSENFVRNLILIEARKACIMPSPPGQLSWDEAKVIADKIASEHKRETLFRINTAKNSITKKTVIAFADAVVDKNLTNLLPNYKIQQKVKTNLHGLDELLEAKSKTISEFVSYKFSPEAPIEISEKVLPHLVDDALREKLPSEWDNDRKDKELKLLTLDANAQLANCLKPFKERINYGAPFKEAMPLRQKLEEEFCQNNSDICAKDNCERTINLFSTEASPRDVERIQGCVLKAMEVAIEGVTGVIILDNLSNMSDLKLGEQEKSLMTQEGKAELRKCLREKIIDYDKISSAEYTSVVESCSSKVELNVAQNIAVHVLLTSKVFSSGGADVSFLGNTFSEDELGSANQVLDNSLIPCYEKLSHMTPVPSASLCSSIIEMETVKHVLDTELMKISTDPRMEQTRMDFRTCVDSAKADAMLAMPLDPTPLLDTRILKCSNTAIITSSEVMAAETYVASIQNNDAMKDKKYALSLKQSVEGRSSACISKRLNEIPNWISFKEFSTSEEFKALKVTCTNEVTAYSVSKIVSHETTIKLNELKNEGVLESESPGLIVASSVETMRKKAGLSSFEKGKDPIEALYLAMLEKDPNLTIDHFVSEFKKTVGNRAIQSIHKDLMAKVQKQSDHPKLSDSLNAQCLGDIFNQFENDLISNEESATDESSPLTPLAELLSDGFSYTQTLSQAAYDQSFTHLKSMCRDIKKYKKLGDFLGDPKLAFLFEARIQKELVTNFTKLANDNYNATVAKLKNDPDVGKLLPFAIKQKEEMLQLIQDKLQNSKNFQSWMNNTNLKAEINSRITGLISGDTKVANALSEKVVVSLFTDKNDYGFASEFTRIQLTSNLGLEGLSEARKTVKESMKDLGTFESGAKDKIYAESLKSLNNHWNPKEIAADLDWHNLQATEREKLITSLYQNAVVPETSSIRRPANMDAIEKTFTATLDKAKTSGNKTFNEKLEDKITKDVKKEVGFWDAAGGWLRPLVVMPLMPILLLP